MSLSSPVRHCTRALVGGALLVVLCAPALAAAQEAGPVTVRIDGIGGELRRNVEQRVGIIQKTRGVDLLEVRIRELHASAAAEIRSALQPFGYYRPEITSSLDRERGVWTARYRVRAGEPVPYASVELELVGPGSDDPVLASELAGYPVRSGQPLRHVAWTRAKETLLHRATARGYLDAAFAEHWVDVDLDEYEARAVLRLETGPRYRFGGVRFEGTHFDRRLLDRFVPFEEDDPFLLEQLLAVQLGLGSSPYFRTVELSTLRDEASDLRIPVVVSLEHRARTGVSAGAGYGTDSGARGTLTWDRRWLGEGGDRLHGELRVSLARRTASGTYIVPVGRRADDEVALTLAGQDDESLEDARSRQLQASVGYAHTRGGWRETVSLGINSEWSEVGNLRSRSTLVLPGIAWSRSRSDDAVVPTRGSSLSLRLTGTHEALVSDVSFARAHLRARVVRSPVQRGRIIARLDVGAVVVDEFATLPVSHRFFAGGDQSIRGFAFGAVGPTNAEGDVVGGRYLATASAEYEHYVVGPVGVAVFADVGNAFGPLSGRLSLERGVGTGLRWRSPIGPVKLDVAWALTREGDPVRLHFNVGAGL